ncbi:unnamed protein product [Phytophthora fragariaefolia]|uniref:Unnamed protein product n=1 Tax=Phytophthora fragariaefolia TaxID=1490495 RepID=A0A9W7D4V5_9STRA|nr:unnamed protein product [Phytophthora fragariaefolia]
MNVEYADIPDTEPPVMIDDKFYTTLRVPEVKITNQPPFRPDTSKLKTKPNSLREKTLRFMQLDTPRGIFLEQLVEVVHIAMMQVIKEQDTELPTPTELRVMHHHLPIVIVFSTMSTASDISAFEHSVEPAPAEALFSSKEWTYIQDSSSNMGQYQGHIQFNLSSISSQAAYVNWEEAFIQIPIKLQIINRTAGNVAPSTPATFDQLVPKAGAWHWINSFQVVVDGVSVQTNQVHENVNAQFKAITEMSYNDYIKSGQTSNFVINEYEPVTSPANTPKTLDNVTTANFMTSINNTSIGEFGLATTFDNKGALARSKYTGSDQQANRLAFDVMGGNANISSVSKLQTWVSSGALQVDHHIIPSIDHALSQKKTFRYFERLTNSFTVAPNQAFTVTVTNGVANPKKLIMPVITNPIAAPTAGLSISNTINPFRSPYSTVPATTFLCVENLQVTVGNIPIWNNPVNFSYDLFLQEMEDSGVDGGLDDDTSKGLLSLQLWVSLYRFVAVDIGRRLPSEDGASKSIIVSGVSNCNYAITVYYHVLREVVATVDTTLGTVSQAPMQK